MLKLVVSEGQLLAQNGPTHLAPESLPPGLLTQEAIHFTPEVMQALSGSPPASGAGPGSSPASGQPAAGQVSVLVNPHSDTFQFAPELLNGPSLQDAKAGPAVHASPAPDHTIEMVGLQPILPVDHGLFHA